MSKMRVVKCKIEIVDHRLREASPIAQNIPDRKLKKSLMLSRCCPASLFDSHEINPKNATWIEVMRFLLGVWTAKEH